MLKIHLRKAHVLIVAILAGAGTVARSVAADAPCGQYSIWSDGTVHDNYTELVWQRSLAQNGMTWNDAMSFCGSAGQGTLPGCGWRLPSVNELQTIVDDSTSNPAIDSATFPNTGSGPYWTSSLDGPGQAWTVAFFYGELQPVATSGAVAVRCVRSAQ